MFTNIPTNIIIYLFFSNNANNMIILYPYCSGCIVTFSYVLVVFEEFFTYYKLTVIVNGIFHAGI